MKKIVRILLIILIILNCICIYKFSSEQSEQSKQTSGKVVDTIVEISPKAKKMTKLEKEKYKESIVTPIRKTAHFTVYTSLGMLLFFFYNTIDFKEKNNTEIRKNTLLKPHRKKQILYSLICAFIYACSDEFHQLHVSGRSGEFRDVCIDSSGALFGILIGLAIVSCIHKISNKKQKKIPNESVD